MNPLLPPGALSCLPSATLPAARSSRPGFASRSREALSIRFMPGSLFFCPVAIEPEDERARLEREFIDAAKTVQAIAERMQRVGIKAVA